MNKVLSLLLLFILLSPTQAQVFKNLYAIKVEINSNVESSTNSITLISPSGLTSSYTFTFPSEDGNANDYLITNGSSALSWIDLGADGGTPGGNNTNIQYKNGVVFGGSDALVWDNTNGRLGIGTLSPEFTVDVRGTALVGDDGLDGEVRLFNEVGATDHVTAFKPTSLMTQSTTYTFPDSYGTDGQFLVTDGNGNLKFVDDAAGGNFDCTGQGTGGGTDNSASGTDTFVGGGTSNVITNDAENSVIGGGSSNTIAGDNSSIVSGINNVIDVNAAQSTIGAGEGNYIDGYNSGIFTGINNYITTSSTQSMIGAGDGNYIDAVDAAILAGTSNTIGYRSQGDGATRSFIGAGDINVIDAQDDSGIFSGVDNYIHSSGTISSIGGGYQNEITGGESFIGGGYQNEIISTQSAIAGGYQNYMSGYRSSILGGSSNTVTGDISLAFGLQAEANADYAVAIGRRAVVEHNGSFVFADATDAEVSSTISGKFTMRFVNGYRMYTNQELTIYVGLTAGCSDWGTCSDSTLKEMILALNGSDYYQKLNDMPVSSWTYKDSKDKSKRHYGPMAQDFFKTFGKDELGEFGSDKTLNVVNLSSVGILSLQGLMESNDELNKELDIELARQERLSKELEEIESRLIELELKDKGSNQDIGKK